jgi:hypothetical protein
MMMRARVRRADRMLLIPLRSRGAELVYLAAIRTERTDDDIRLTAVLSLS